MRRYLLGTMGLLLTLFIVACGTAAPTTGGNTVQETPKGQEASGKSESKLITIGTASSGGNLYVLAVGIADLVSKNSSISATAESVGGSDANMRALKAKKVDMATVTSLPASTGFAGTGAFEKDGPIPVGLIAQGGSSYRQLVVKADAGINTPADLVGKKVIMRRKALGDIEQFANAVLKAYNVSVDQLTALETTDTNEVVEALKMGAADAAFMPATVPDNYYMDLSQTTDVKLISIDKDKIPEVLKEMGPAFSAGVVPPGTYDGQNEPVNLVRQRHILVVRKDISEDVVYEATKAFMGNLNKFQNVHATAPEWTAEGSLDSPPIPFHPGAVRYYKEIGAWKDDLPVLK